MANPGKILLTQTAPSQSICTQTGTTARLYRITNNTQSGGNMSVQAGMHNIAIAPGTSADVSAPTITVGGVISAGNNITGSYEFIA